MMQFAYLVALLVSLAGLVVLDYRYKIALSVAPRRTLLTIGLAVGIFIIWDLCGIALGIFYHGGSEYTLPITLLPEFPIEELFFLILLTYVSLLIYRKAAKV